MKPDATDFCRLLNIKLPTEKARSLYRAQQTIAMYLLICALMTTMTQAAEKTTTTTNGKSFQSGVVLTFDDRYVDQWVQQITLFKKYDAHVTFFVDHFYTLNPAQIAGLKKLQDAGHAIGSHSVNHIKAVDYVRTKGMKAYLQNEIDPSVKRLTEAGFIPTAFAYPSSSRNEEIDSALLKTFRHLRGGTGLTPGQRMRDLKAIFTPVDQVAGRGCLIGTGVDYAGTEKRPDYLTEIKDAMDHAKQRGEIVVFYAHNISENGPGHHLSPRALEEILAHAQQIGLPTLTYDELP